jgi:hypothetical protein
VKNSEDGIQKTEFRIQNGGGGRICGKRKAGGVLAGDLLDKSGGREDHVYAKGQDE